MLKVICDLHLKMYTSSDTLQEAGDTRLHTEHRYAHDQFKMLMSGL